MEWECERGVMTLFDKIKMNKSSAFLGHLPLSCSFHLMPYSEDVIPSVCVLVYTVSIHTFWRIYDRNWNALLRCVLHITQPPNEFERPHYVFRCVRAVHDHILLCLLGLVEPPNMCTSMTNKIVRLFLVDFSALLWGYAFDHTFLSFCCLVYFCFLWNVYYELWARAPGARTNETDTKEKKIISVLFFGWCLLTLTFLYRSLWIFYCMFVYKQLVFFSVLLVASVTIVRQQAHFYW